MSVLALLACASILSWLRFQGNDREPVFKIDVVLERDVQGDLGSTMSSLLSSLNQPHIRITLKDEILISQPSGSVLEFKKALKEASSRLSSKDDATYTILVTSRRLYYDPDWHNMFYVTAPRSDPPFGVVSIHEVADLRIAGDRELPLRYLVTMVPLVTMLAAANKLGREPLIGRGENIDQGCLLDFSKHREYLIDKIRRGPRLCKKEVDELSGIFGSVVIKEYEALLDAIRNRRE